MTNLNLERYIEHTLLRPDATIQEIKKLADEAIKYNFLGVCVNPLYVQFIREYLQDNSVKVVTVIGFPLGANLTDVKVFEAVKAIEDGADEIDMVIDIGAIKDKNFKRAENDIKAIVDNSENKPVKVILETDLLEQAEIVQACKISVEAGANFVKTSTGFVKGGVGATVENLELMYKTVQPYGINVKASGGIKDKESTLLLVKAGATRIGTSSGVNIVS